MGFLPDVYSTCETCRGTGYLPEAWEVRLHGYSLPELFELTIDQVSERFADEDALVAAAAAWRKRSGWATWCCANRVMRSLEGEAQRLKIAKELCRSHQSRRCSFWMNRRSGSTWTMSRA